MRGSLITHIVVLGSLGWPAPRIATAQNTFQDPQARFALDLPAGFKLTNEQLGRFYVFQGNDARIFVVAVIGKSDRDQLWRSAIDEFTGPGVPPPRQEAVTDLDVNGHPARLARYTVETEADGKTVPFTALLGAVLIRGTGTGVAYFALLNDKAAGRWEEPILQAFHSIRSPGPPVIIGT